MQHHSANFMAKANLQTLPLHHLQRGQYQPRQQFDQAALEELALSIRSNGLLQPILVRPLKAGRYEIIAGERRWRACQLAQLDAITCLVREMSDEQAAEAAAIENINRVDLNPIEEAKAYQRLIDEFGYIHDEIAAAIGKSRTKITNALRLLKLNPTVQQMIIDNLLSEGHGKVLAGLQSAQQLPLAKQCVQQQWSVRKIEQAVKKHQDTALAPTHTKDPNLTFLERRLSDHLGSKAKIDFHQTKGQVTIDFKNLDILEGLLKKMGYEDVV